MGRVRNVCDLWTYGGAITYNIFALSPRYMHLAFGLFLIWTGIQAAIADDDDDPTENPVVVWLSQTLPIINVYDSKGRFFVRGISSCRLLFEGLLFECRSWLASPDQSSARRGLLKRSERSEGEGDVYLDVSRYTPTSTFTYIPYLDAYLEGVRQRIPSRYAS